MNHELRITNKVVAVFIFLMIVFSVFGLVGGVGAADVGRCPDKYQCAKNAKGVCPMSDGTKADCSADGLCPDCYELQNPLRTQTSDIPALVCLVLTFLSSRVMPPVAVFMVLYASFLLLTSTGDPGKVSTARQVLVYTIIGAGVMLLAVPLVALVTEVLGKSINPLCSVQNASSTFLDTFIRLINWFSWFIAITSVVVGLYAGFLYMTAQGEPQKVATASKTIFYAVVGIMVAVLAFSVIAIINGFIL